MKLYNQLYFEAKKFGFITTLKQITIKDEEPVSSKIRRLKLSKLR